MFKEELPGLKLILVLSCRSGILSAGLLENSVMLAFADFLLAFIATLKIAWLSSLPSLSCSPQMPLLLQNTADHWNGAQDQAFIDASSTALFPDIPPFDQQSMLHAESNDLATPHDEYPS